MLDHVDQGFVTLDRNGTISVERSRAFNNWFGPCTAGSHSAECLGQASPDLSATILVAYERVVADVSFVATRTICGVGCVRSAYRACPRRERR